MPSLASINISQNVLILTGVFITAGVILLFLAPRLFPQRHTVHDVLRDIGIAFIVAAIVSTLYEQNTRSMFDVERMEGVLKTVLASNVPKNVWEQVNSEILQRDVIRHNTDIRVSLKREKDMPDCQMVLRLEIGYDLHGLRAKTMPYILVNELNYYNMQNVKQNLPRFESVTVGKEVYKDARLAQIFKEGVIKVGDINLGPSGTPPIPINIVRKVAVNVPGDYDLVMSELTDKVRVHMDEIPDDIDADVKIWSNKGEATLEPAGKIWYFNGVLFPGQGLSIRFKKR